MIWKSKQAFTTVVVVLGVLSFPLLLACGSGGGAGSVEEDSQAPPVSTPDVPIHEPTTTAMEPLVTALTSDLAPIDNEPIKVKIDRVIEQAKETKKEYEVFRERMFDEAFAQIQTVLCSTYRMQLLAGKPRDFYRGEPELYIEPLQDVLARQGNQPFVDLSREKPTSSAYETVVQESVSISIPKSEAYTKRSLALATLTFKKQPVSFTSSDGLTTEFEEQEVLERVVWSFDPLVKCEQSFREPVVNSPSVRKESSRRMAVLIASSLSNLREYPGKLETVEQVWARANDLQPLLDSLNDRLVFNEDDPTARRDVHNYERELTKALVDLGRTKAEGRGEPSVDQAEVKEILRLFR